MNNTNPVLNYPLYQKVVVPLRSFLHNNLILLS